MYIYVYIYIYGGVSFDFTLPCLTTGVFFVELTVLQLTWKRISARSRIGEQHDSPSFLFLFIDVYIMMFIGDISIVYMAIISFPSWAHRSQAENASGDISGSLIAP